MKPATPAAILLVFLAGAVVRSQLPAPPIAWEPWKPIALGCAQATYEYAITKDDGRNDFQVKLRARNSTTHPIATRFKAVLTSASGKKAYRDGGSRIGPGRVAEGGRFHFGQPFETPVNVTVPVHVRWIELTEVEVANVEKPPAYATPSTYLSDFVDFPTEKCASQRVDTSSAPKFVLLTNACYGGLPRWAPACQDAVDAIMKYADTASEAEVECLKEWRAFQKCYEIYAFNSTPDPKPTCASLRPHCTVR